MFEKLRKILNKADADYVDIRYENKKDTFITFKGKELTRIGSNSTDGYVLRVLKNEGFSSVAFTKESDAENAIKSAIENAKLLAKNTEKPIKLAKADAIKDTFFPELIEDPRKISINEKLELTKKLNSIPLKHEKVINTNIGYGEVIRERFFLNSEGSEIREDLITTRLGGLITSKEGNLLQNVRVSAGGSDGFQNVRNQEANFEKQTSIVVDLLKAKPVKAGVQTDEGVDFVTLRFCSQYRCIEVPQSDDISCKHAESIKSVVHSVSPLVREADGTSESFEREHSKYTNHCLSTFERQLRSCTRLSS